MTNLENEGFTVLMKHRETLTQRQRITYIPEDLDPQPHRCDNLKSRSILYVYSLYIQ
jgi:hypothetical protein